MTGTPQGNGEPVQPGRRLIRRLALAGAAVVALLLLVYVTLPYWLPTDTLRRHVQKDLSRQCGAVVTLDELTIGWRQGLMVKNLRVAGPSDAANDDAMLRVGTIRAQFSPLTMLLKDRIDWAVLQDVGMSVRSDDAGRAALGRLLGMQGKAYCRHVNLRGGLVTLTGQAGSTPVQFKLGSGEFDCGPNGRLDRVALNGEILQAGTSAKLTIDAKAGGSATTAASATVRFEGLRLEQFPLAQWLDGVEAARGTAGGEVRIDLTPQLVADECAVDITVADLTVLAPRLGGWSGVQQARIAGTAAIDLLKRRVQIRDLGVTVPGLELTGTADLVDGGSEAWAAVESVDLNGRANPMAMAAVLGQAGRWPEGLATQGWTKLKCQGRRDESGLVFYVGLDAKDLDITRGSQELKPAGTDMSLAAAGTLQGHGRWVALDHLSIKLGRNELAGSGRIAGVEPNANASISPAAILGWLADGTELHGQWSLSDPQVIATLMGVAGLSFRPYDRTN